MFGLLIVVSLLIIVLSQIHILDELESFHTIVDRHVDVHDQEGYWLSPSPSSLRILQNHVKVIDSFFSVREQN